MKTFNDYLEENHLKPGTKLKKGDEELKVVKPVGDDKYLVKEEQVTLDESTKDYHTKMASAHEKAIASAKTSDLKSLHTRAMNLHKKAAEHGNKQTIDMANELSSKLKDGMSSLPSSMKPVSPSDYRRQGAVTHAYAKNEEVEQTDESMVARTQNGRRMVSAEAAIRLARELAAKRKEGEKATHKDLQAASAALRKEEVELDEGIASKIKSAVKKVKRATQGWGTGNAPSPKELVKRNKEYDDDGVKSMHASIHGSGIKSQKHSPGDLQKRVIDREMKKRGLTKEAVEQIDELSKETHMSYATVAGDHAVRLAKAIKVRREQGKGSSQEVKDMESERDKRVAGLSRLAKRVAEAKEEKLPKDMTGAKCEKCKKDKYKERSQFDDMDGKVTCSCGHRVDRWKKYKN